MYFDTHYTNKSFCTTILGTVIYYVKETMANSEIVIVKY